MTYAADNYMRMSRRLYSDPRHASGPQRKFVALQEVYDCNVQLVCWLRVRSVRIAVVDVHQLATILEVLCGERFTIIKQQLNGWSVLKYPMVKEMLCDFRCQNTFHGYRLNHFGEPIGGEKEVLATSHCLDELSESFNANCVPSGAFAGNS